MILQDKVVGNVFHFFKLIQVLLHFVSFLIWIHFIVFNFYIHLYTKSTIFIFYFPSYPFVSDQWYEFRVKSSMNSDLFFGSFTPDFEQNVRTISIYIKRLDHYRNFSLSFVLFKYRLGNLALHVFLICISRVTFEYLTWPWPRLIWFCP